MCARHALPRRNLNSGNLKDGVSKEAERMVRLASWNVVQQDQRVSRGVEKVTASLVGGGYHSGVQRAAAVLDYWLVGCNGADPGWRNVHIFSE